jgi:hypothetical protein
MVWTQKLEYFAIASTVITQLIMISLQVRAFREHGHGSFLLLSVATACGLLYVIVGQILGYLSHTIFAPPIWVFASVTIFLFAQMIISVWGTASLFRSYRQLNVASRTVASNSACNSGKV